MSRKLWLSTVTVAIALLAVFAGSAVAKTGKTGAVGGTLNVDISTDVDYTDPALDYLSTGWEIEYATCLKLMNYPDANGAKGSQLVPEAATGFPKVSNSGKTYDFTVNAGFTKFSNGQAVTAANSRPRSTATLTRRCSHLLFRSSATWSVPTSRPSRASRSRAAPDHQLDQGCSGLPCPYGDAVLLRRPDEPGARPERCAQSPVGRSVLHLRS